MSDESDKPKTRRPVRRQRSIYQVHYCLPRREDDAMAKPLVLPSDQPELQAYGPQVAGHQSHAPDSKYLGLLQCNGKILKPILKESQKREVDFYTRVWSSTDPGLVELQKYVPRYYGCRKFTYNGFEQDYIILEDLTDRMLEPCIMDIKIGRRTWDPLASEEKIQKEKSKYKLCKEEFAFCIPGFQVYKISTGKLHKYNKEYGKKLHGHMVKAAIRTFLNAGGAGGGGGGGRACRSLVLQLVSALWGVQRWAARARPLRLYAASLLLAYDAARLRACRCCCCRSRSLTKSHPQLAPLGRRASAPGAPGAPGAPSGGQPYMTLQSAPAGGGGSPWGEALDRLAPTHSFANNYDDELGHIKVRYRALLARLAGDAPPSPWGVAGLIDFAHAFFDERGEGGDRGEWGEREQGGERGEGGVDRNFKEGVDSLVQIFEALLSETDDCFF